MQVAVTEHGKPLEPANLGGNEEGVRQQCTGYSGRVLCDQAYKRFMQCRALERAAFPAPVVTGAGFFSRGGMASGV